MLDFRSSSSHSSTKCYSYLVVSVVVLAGSEEVDLSYSKSEEVKVKASPRHNPSVASSSTVMLDGLNSPSSSLSLSIRIHTPPI
jgi:hypothetical protein